MFIICSKLQQNTSIYLIYRHVFVALLSQNAAQMLHVLKALLIKKSVA